MRSPFLARRCSVVGALFPLLVAPLAAQWAPPANAEAGLARYRECIQRKPFYHHVEGRAALAYGASAEVLAMLADDYGSAKTAPEFTRYTTAFLIGRHFNRSEFAPALQALRQRFAKPIDAWLWHETLRVQVLAGDEQPAVDIALGEGPAWQRAAAIAAIGASRRGNVKSPIVAAAATFPKKDADRMLLLGAMTGALYEQRRRVNDEEYREALSAYIGLLGEDVKLLHLGKVQMARHLQDILKAPAMFVNAEAWLELLQRGDVKTKVDTHTTVQPRFFGIETEGERFCYVLDLSDSMCKKIEPEAKPGGPITGPKQKKNKKSMVLDESDLPWHTIQTRWDLAREQMRISLSRLTPDKYFSVVWFGTEAGTLNATKGMVKATRANITKVMAELDSIQTGPPQPGSAPDGTLRGRTNLHSGLRVAFGLTDRGYVEEQAYVDGDALTEGCDTMFLLSDGAPSWDGFPAVDTNYNEGKVVLDVEYGAAAPNVKTVEYQGPFVHDEWIVEDLRRMNAFRRIRMHCVGLGEANVGLLKRLAEIGTGDVFVVGEKKASQSGGK